MRYLDIPLAFFLSCLGIWLFADSIWWIDDQRELIKNQIISETVLNIGVKKPCIVKINLSVWDSMNTLGVYAWVAACENQEN